MMGEPLTEKERAAFRFYAEEMSAGNAVDRSVSEKLPEFIGRLLDERDSLDARLRERQFADQSWRRSEERLEAQLPNVQDDLHRHREALADLAIKMSKQND